MNQTDLTASELRAMAAASEQAAEESFQRCDTDGFVTQFSSQLHASLYRTQADIAENGGKASFPALFDLRGHLVPAKWLETRFGRAWGILESGKPNANIVAWFNPSNAENPALKRRNNAKKGYYVGNVLAPANAKISAPPGARGFSGMSQCYIETYRLDGGFSTDVIIIDNGL